MSLALGRLRLAPAAFWAMTPRELAAALAPFAAGEALRGDGLAALMRAYPDG